MNKRFFQSMFSNATSGQVYRFIGTVPGGVYSDEYITNLYVQAMGQRYDTTVVEIPEFRTTVLFSSAAENLLDSPNFELITDLTPDPIPEPLPEPESEGNVEVGGGTTPE